MIEDFKNFEIEGYVLKVINPKNENAAMSFHVKFKEKECILIAWKTMKEKIKNNVKRKDKIYYKGPIKQYDNRKNAFWFKILDREINSFIIHSEAILIVNNIVILDGNEDFLQKNL